VAFKDETETAYDKTPSRDLSESMLGLNMDLAEVNREISGRKSHYDVATVNSMNANLY